MANQDNTQLTNILLALEGMLNELTGDELNNLEDFIVNNCENSYVDRDGNYPNFFRMVLD